ncbi:MAG TPA: alanine racemase [Pyrinomonadaceae bacterium]|nr:alanine racemase [Pyrinomonadaceae bacterium]
MQNSDETKQEELRGDGLTGRSDNMSGRGDNVTGGADGASERASGRPTCAEIDLDALAWNFQAVRRRVAPGVKVMAVVKADAYGHGAPGCARRLAAEGADWFGVATPEEGIELRRAGLAQPILSFGGFWAGQAEACIRHRITPVVYRFDMAESLDAAARAAGVVADAHIKIDTGMGRLGVRYDEAAEFAEKLRALRNVRVEGLMTHFAAADDPGRDCFTAEQLNRYGRALEIFRERGHSPVLEHAANSAGTFAHPEAWGNMVRPGGVLYGLWRDVLPPTLGDPQLRPVMSVRSRITLLKRVHRGETLGYGCTFEASREMLVATLPIGYHDGYARALSNRGRVIVRGQLASVTGRISMDLTLVDVTDVSGVEVGDRVTLVGIDGELSIAAEDVAKTVGTISYEITCGISSRVPRVYLEA